MTDDELAYITPIAGRIARRMAPRWAHVGVDVEDLTQELLCCALEADRTFDPSRSSDRRGHLISTMQRRTIDYVRRGDVVSHPYRSIVARVLAAQESLQVELGGTVTVEEAAELAGVSVARWRVVNAAIHQRNALRIDAPIDAPEGDTGSYADVIPSHEADRDESTPATDALHVHCSRRERAVIAARIGGETFARIGAAWGITAWEAKVTHDAALARLRELLAEPMPTH